MAKQKKQVKQNKLLIESGLFSPDSLCLVCSNLRVTVSFQDWIEYLSNLTKSTNHTDREVVVHCDKTKQIFQPEVQFNLISQCEHYESQCC